jgi:L-ascorbate metabolism protein UlaG (beta-lactamase superfamily)
LKRLLTVTAILTLLTLVAAAAYAQGLVRVTPLGSHDGELCSRDRAMLFEDPTGVRILYDPGQTVDETDPRLGSVDVMLLSHAHIDHIGDRRPGHGGTCDAPTLGAPNPQSNFATIAAAKNAAAFLVSSELDTFLARKIQNVTGSPTTLCVARDRNDDTILPRTSPCVARIHPGGSLVVRHDDAAGIRIYGVQAVHNNGIAASLIDPPGIPPGTTAYGGSPGGYILRFTNGLTVYLTGDTGVFSDMEILGKLYDPRLVVINAGDVGTLGPAEAAYVIKHLVQSTRTVMPSHIYEQATEDGRVRPGSRLEQFINLVRGSATVVVPLSNVTRSFDSEGRCVDCH